MLGVVFVWREETYVTWETGEVQNSFFAVGARGLARPGLGWAGQGGSSGVVVGRL